MVKLNDVEREVTLRALKHYMLQCEMWRDATATVRGDDDRGTLNWALMIERIGSCIQKVSTSNIKPETHEFEAQVVELIRKYKAA